MNKKFFTAFLVTSLTLGFNGTVSANSKEMQHSAFNAVLEKLEGNFNGKIGVYAINTNNNEILAYRAEERFPIQSTLKLIAVAALLQQANTNTMLLNEKIHYTANDLTEWHPITGRYVKQGMSYRALASAAISYSDNPAANLIIKKLGGPQAVTSFAHSIGNKTFNVSHYEGNLNSNPNNVEDTATPKDMGLSVKNLTIGNVLAPSLRAKLINWMKDSTTSYQRMRAGALTGWTVADKTGSGDYGVANDIGLIWSPTCKPIILAIYTVRSEKDAARRDDMIAAATTAVLAEFSKNTRCFKELS